MTMSHPRWGVAAGLALIVVTNAVVLAGVKWNRSGEPEAVLTLTQRELTLPYFQIDEDTGLSLRLALGGDPWWEEGDETWLDRQKLAELGFAVNVDPTAPEAQRYYADMLPRQVFVALEYDGAAWAAWLARQERGLAEAEAKVATGEMAAKRLEELRADLSRAGTGHSRLFVVDASRDAVALRRQYPDRTRYAVVPAVVRLHRGIREPGAPPRLTGHVSNLLVDRLHVSLRQRPTLDAVLREAEKGQSEGGGSAYRPGEERPPRYQATVAFGRRHEPWLVAVESLPAAQ